MGLFLDPGATAPRQTHPGDAYDLFAYSSVVPGGEEQLLSSKHSARIRPHRSLRIGTGVHFVFPIGFRGLIHGRSGLAFTSYVDVGPGYIDNQYVGSLNVLLFNHGEDSYTVKQGDRIAQISVERYWEPIFEKLTVLPATARGGAGFGSSGLR